MKPIEEKITTLLRLKVVLLFAICGPAIGALPMALPLALAGLNDSRTLAWSLVPILFAYPVAIIPATFAGILYASTMGRFTCLTNRARLYAFMLGALHGMLAATAFAGFIVYLTKKPDSFTASMILLGTLSGGACGMLSMKITNRWTLGQATEGKGAGGWLIASIVVILLLTLHSLME